MPSPLGMRGFPPLARLALDGLPSQTLFVSISSMSRLKRPCSALLARRGYPVIDGLDMLIGAGRPGLPLFFGARAPREHDEELAELLTS